MSIPTTSEIEVYKKLRRAEIEVCKKLRRALSSEFPKQALLRMVENGDIPKERACVAYENRFGMKLDTNRG